MVEAALAAGIPVLVEKPLALTPDEGRQMVAAAESAGVKLGVNYPYRYDTGCYALARAVQAGALGEVRYARCHLPWHRDASHFGASGWHARLSTAGGGTLITQGSYPLDVARSATPLAGHSPDVEVEDVAQGIAEMAAAARQVCSSMAIGAEQAVGIIYGAHGSALQRPLT